MHHEMIRDNLRDEINAALELLDGPSTEISKKDGPIDQIVLNRMLPSLLTQCRKIIAAQKSEPASIRTVHHLACTGGTLIARCIAAQPNIHLLSEVDPLSPIAHRHPFTPSDVIGLAKFGSQPPDDQALIQIFLAGFDVLYQNARKTAVTMVLRDHSHSQFMCAGEIRDRPGLREILAEKYELHSLVTVRHPLDSFLSLRNNNWVGFSPDTLTEYARRYQAFLKHHAKLEILRYEDFVKSPEQQMQHICAVLNLNYNDGFMDVFSALSLSGDSGRSGDTIGLRPRKPIPESIRVVDLESPEYTDLCSQLGYNPKVESGSE